MGEQACSAVCGMLTSCARDQVPKPMPYRDKASKYRGSICICKGELPSPIFADFFNSPPALHDWRRKHCDYSFIYGQVMREGTVHS